MKSILTAAALISLTGCSIMQRQAVSKCDTEHPDGPGHYVDHAICINAAEAEYSRYHDGDALIRNSRLTLANKVQAGRMSPDDAAMAMDQIAFGVHQQQAQEDAVRMQAATALLGMSAAMAQQAQPYQMPMQAPVYQPAMTCTAFGGRYVSCK